MLLLASCVGGGLPLAQDEGISAPTAQPEAATVAPAEPTTVAEAESAEPEAAEPEAAEEQAALDEPILFQIISDESEARFIIEEVLLGNNKTVIGVTSEVSGEISVTPSDPSAAQISTITINARSFATDSSRRNRAIQRQVLLTAKDEYQFISFEPTSIEGMPASVAVGDTVAFTVIGNLTIVDTTRSEAFQMTLTVISEEEIKGLASLTVFHADFGLSIPNVPIVASVEDEVRLELDFTARANR